MKELLNERKKELKKYYDDVFHTDKMTTYCINKIAYIIELTNGCIITLEKETIKKDFCFGYGYNGIPDEESEKEAYKMQEFARNNYNYFISKNLEGINDKIQELKDSRKVYVFNHYYRQSHDNKLRTYYCINNAYDEERFNMTKYENVEELKQEDINKIIEGLEEIKKDFIKRLNTYLKKYGLSKLHTWTYLVD